MGYAGPRGPYNTRDWIVKEPEHPLRLARLAKGLTQAQLAAELDVNRARIAQIESGLKELDGWSETARKLKKFIADNAPAPAKPKAAVTVYRSRR